MGGTTKRTKCRLTAHCGISPRISAIVTFEDEVWVAIPLVDTAAANKAVNARSFNIAMKRESRLQGHAGQRYPV